MNRDSRFGLIFATIFLLVASLCLAVSPFVPQTGGLLTIETPKLGFYQTGDYDFDINIHVFNSTGSAVTNTSTNCTIHIYNRTGHEVYDKDAKYLNEDFYWTLDRNITNKADEYAYIVYCKNKEDGFASGTFVMGYEDTEPIFYLGIVLGLVALIAIVLSIAFKLDSTHAPIIMFLIWLSFGLVVLLASYLHQLTIITLMPITIISLLETLYTVSVILLIVISVYFMIYYLTTVLEYLKGQAANKKWWTKKDAKDQG